MNGPALDLDAVRAELGQYQGVPGYLNLWSLPDKLSYSFPTDPDGIAEAVSTVGKLDADQHSIYHQGTTLREQVAATTRGTGTNVAMWLGYRADVDYGKPGYPPGPAEAAEAMAASDLPEPTRWVHSGHGLYPVWQIDPPVPDSPDVRALADDIDAELSRTFAACGYGIDKGVSRDPVRLWRVPGTVNRKPDHPEPTQCEHWSGTGEVFTWGELRNAVPVRARPDHGDARRMGDRRFTSAQAMEYVETYALSRLREAEPGSINTQLNQSAGTIGHFVGEFFAGPIDAAVDKAIGILLDELAHTEYDAATWQAEPTIRSGLAFGMADPYTWVPDPADAEPGSDADAKLLAEEVGRERRRREARRIVDEENRPALPPIADTIVWDDDLESIPSPSWAVPGLLPERAVGWLGGPSGSYKSFVAVSLAGSLAYGVPVLAHPPFAPRGTRKVAYVAAEGSSGVGLRLRALRHHHGIDARRRLAVYPRAVDLTSERDVDRLAEWVLDNGIGFLVVDTFRQTTLGVNENDNTEVGIVLGRLLRLRDEHGVSTILVDHTNKSATGLADLGGAGAKRANTDYVLMVDMNGGQERGPHVQRTLRVAKFKDAQDGEAWPIRLETVHAVTDADGIPSAVAIRGEVESDGGAIVDTSPWWEQPLPPAVERMITGNGRQVGREILRFLFRNIDNTDGWTRADLRSTIKEHPRWRDTESKSWRSVWSDGWSCVMREGKELIAPSVASSDRFVLDPMVQDAART